MFGPAWSDPTYLNIAKLVVAAILVTGAILFPFRNRHPALLAAWASIKSWIFAAPILFFIIGLPEPWPLVGITVGVIFCAKEFFQITGMYHRSMFVWLTYFGIIVQAYSIHSDFLRFYDQMPMIMTGLILLVPLLRNSYKLMLQYTALSTFNFIFMGWGLLHMGRILKMPEGHLHLIFIILLAEACDNVALASGRLFGKIKILDKVSNRRTLEGTLISLVFTMLLAYLLRDVFISEPSRHWIIAGLVAFVAGSLGDLALAVIRRDLGVKDMGLFIWGRGGILDVMDRMIFVAPIYYYSLKFMNEGLL